MIRQAVHDLSNLGQLPPEVDACEQALDAIGSLVLQIEAPLSDDEARLLCKVFGPEDSCFGLAWSLLHLIETAPGWPLPDCLSEPRNEWTDRLKRRADNAA